MKLDKIKHYTIRRSEQAAGIAKSDFVKIGSVVIGSVFGIVALFRRR